MNLVDAKRLAEELLEFWGLADEGWTFAFDHAKRRFGQCSYTRRVISLSRHLTELNDRCQVEDTILHEIAHARAGSYNGHNYVWRQQCRLVGAEPTACYSSAEVISPSPNYEGVCPNCKRVASTRLRLKAETRTRACTQCCDNYNGGAWSYRFVLQWRKAQGTTQPQAQPIKKSDWWNNLPTIEELNEKT